MTVIRIPWVLNSASIILHDVHVINIPCFTRTSWTKFNTFMITFLRKYVPPAKNSNTFFSHIFIFIQPLLFSLASTTFFIFVFLPCFFNRSLFWKQSWVLCNFSLLESIITQWVNSLWTLQFWKALLRYSYLIEMNKEIQ